MPEPATCVIPIRVYRVGRREHLLEASEIEPEDAVLRTAGNRFDVPGGAVLYAATEILACYAETLARFRPTPRIRDLLKHEKGFMVAGGIPQDWRLQRQIAVIEPRDCLPFLDIEHPDTQAHLSEVLAGELVGFGYDDNLDISAVCNMDRRLSRAIALYAYSTTDPTGDFVYSGVRYCSRLNPDWECWAIFDPGRLHLVEQRAILISDPDLEKVAEMWDLRVF